MRWIATTFIEKLGYHIALLVLLVIGLYQGPQIITSVFLIALMSKLHVLLVLGFEKLLLLPFAAFTIVILTLAWLDYKKRHIQTLSPGFLAVPLLIPGLGY
jgi:hypothetical protein